jgi:hypothetical protein
MRSHNCSNDACLAGAISTFQMHNWDFNDTRPYPDWPLMQIHPSPSGREGNALLPETGVKIRNQSESADISNS